MGQIKNIKLHIVTDIKPSLDQFQNKMSAAFQTAAEEAKNLAAKPTNDEMLKLYSLYKQATVGDCNTSRPGMLSTDLAGKAKWDAWNKMKGKDKSAAEAEYIDHVEQLKATYGTK